MLQPTLRSCTRSSRILRRNQLQCAFTWLQQTQQTRFAHYAAVVAGAGPAGLAALGNLLEQQPPSETNKYLWVDPDFEGGQLGKSWRAVPSNTKANLFVEYGRALQPFRDVSHNGEGNGKDALKVLESLPQDQGCDITHAADLTVQLSEGLKGMNGVQWQTGEVTGASWDSRTQRWNVEVQPYVKTEMKYKTVSTDRLVLCTGATPTEIPLPIPDLAIAKISLKAALSAYKLGRVIEEKKSHTVAVVGASHSAILVLLNLSRLAGRRNKELKVKWFTRQPLRYAEHRDGWIYRDNTGLKGLAADFARKNLEDAVLSTSEEAKCIEKIDCSGGFEREQAQYQKHLHKCEYIVQATGFAANPLPKLSRDGQKLEVKYDHESGGFLEVLGTHDGGTVAGDMVKGLFGAGIAFPERVKDPEGNVEYAVGMWKFMKFLKRVTPDWIRGNQGGEAKLA